MVDGKDAQSQSQQSTVLPHDSLCVMQLTQMKHKEITQQQY